MDAPVASAAVQDYLKAVYQLESQGQRSPSVTVLADHLHVRPASVSGMVSRLAEDGLVEHARYRGVRLTAAGRRMALAVVRRHRLLETLLVEELGMGWDEVHAEAEALEHSVSDRLLARIAAKLGEPTRDPHGDPIPSADLAVDEAATQILELLPVGARGRVVRVLGAEPELLAYLDRQGIALGDELEVLTPEPFGGSLRVSLRGRERRLGRLAARSLAVEVG
jgi:DtxR family transcriptional regulator, Mn-dependent transcriptional regulator